MYKFIDDTTIKRIPDNTSIPRDASNRDYQKFVDDVRTLGLEIVEGADVQTQSSYVDARKAEYPPLEDQLDKIYHSGVNAWKADIKVIKDKYPKSQIGVTTTVIPHWVYDITN